MNRNNTLEIKISNSTNVCIEAIKDEINLEQSVYAINWFNTKSMWLYNFYNILATPLVNKVDAKSFIKAKVKKVIIGSVDDDREVLLIVRYPNLLHFKKLLEMKLFLLVSLFRMVSVKDFTFGFTHKLDAEDNFKEEKQKRYYVVHHYKTSHNISLDMKILCQENKIELFYSGEVSALLSDVPCLMDGIAIIKSDDENKLEAFCRSEKYKMIIDKTQSSFIAMIDRI